MTPPTQPELDLNATIASAVNARIEAEVVRALSGDETIGRLVAAALQQQVEVKENGGYRTTKVPFMTLVLRKAIQDATKEATQRLIVEELPTIEAEVRKALRRNVAAISEALAKNLADNATKPYGVSVDLALRWPG